MSGPAARLRPANKLNDLFRGWMMNRTMMRVLGLCLVLTAMFSFVGCNTVEGAGKDVENAGEAVQDVAD